MDGTSVGSLHYDLNIDDKNLKGQLDAADRQVAGFSDRVSQSWDKSVRASKAFMVGVAAAGAATVAFGVASVKAFEESQNAIAQTEAVLKSTGNAAGVTAEQVTKLATSLQKQTKFSDEDVRSAENLLLTFTSIGKDIFPDATKTVLDMSTALGQDLKSSSVQLGKALQDPINGITALRRVGVNFTDDQQAVIAKLVETGKTAEAQRLIIAELNKEFGGSAAAAGDTFAGKIEKLKNQFNDLQEDVGQFLIEALGPLVSTFDAWVQKVTEAGGLMEYLKGVFDRNKGTIELVAGAIAGALVPAVVALAVAFASVLIELAPFMLIGAALFYLWNNNQMLFWGLVGALTALGIVLATILLPPLIATAVAAVVAAAPFILLGLAIAAVGVAIGIAAYLIITHFQQVKDFIGGVVDAIIGFFTRIPGYLMSLGGTIVDAIVWPYKTAFNLIADLWNNTVGKLSFKAPDWVPGIGGKGFSMPKIPKFDTGVTNFQGGLAYVHAGEMLVNLPPGTDVVPKNQGGGNTINIGVVQDRSDADYILRRLDRNNFNRSIGVSPV